LPEQDLPSVSIIIPTTDRLELLAPCLDSIRKRTLYPDAKREIVVVDNRSADADTLRHLKEAVERGAISLLRDEGEFNYARLNNLAARETNADVLVFLNNDTLIDDLRWLQFLVSQAMQEDVGAVGPKLLYPDRTVQFGGTVLAGHGALHAHVGLGENDGGYRGLANTTREVIVVTGACLAIRRKVFEEMGGFDENLAVEFNDVLLCLETLKRGYRNLYLARPLLIHLESKTRGLNNTPEKHDRTLAETRYAYSRHRALFQNDPFYSPNLSYDPTYAIAVPPRRRKPWRALGRSPNRVLLLSNVHDEFHWLSELMRRQAADLQNRGYEVFVGGPQAARETPYAEGQRVFLSGGEDAAVYAVARDIDCIVAHTSPFYSVLRWIGGWPEIVFCDYGEPDPGYSASPTLRHEEQGEKRFCLAIGERVLAISAIAESRVGSTQADETLAKLTAAVAVACGR
jgi:GT2 family glycosyltransferase